MARDYRPLRVALPKLPYQIGVWESKPNSRSLYNSRPYWRKMTGYPDVQTALLNNYGGFDFDFGSFPFLPFPDYPGSDGWLGPPFPGSGGFPESVLGDIVYWDGDSYEPIPIGDEGDIMTIPGATGGTGIGQLPTGFFEIYGTFDNGTQAEWWVWDGNFWQFLGIMNTDSGGNTASPFNPKIRNDAVSSGDLGSWSPEILLYSTDRGETFGETALSATVTISGDTAIDSQGRIYASDYTDSGSSFDGIAYSDDQGANWSEAYATQGGIDTTRDVTVSEYSDQLVFRVVYDSDGTNRDHYLDISADRGVNWSTVLVKSDSQSSPAAAGERNAVALSTNRIVYPFMVGAASGTADSHHIYTSYSDDLGANWSTPVEVHANGTNERISLPYIQELGGTLFLFHGNLSISSGHPGVFYRSTDGGDNWTQLNLPVSGDAGPQYMPARYSNFGIVVVITDSSTTQPWLLTNALTCTNGTENWENMNNAGVDVLYVTDQKAP